MGKFEDYLETLVEDGTITGDAADAIRDFSANTPIRRELDTAQADAKKYRDVAMKAVFEQAGIKASPDALNLPADLDITDASKVQEWAHGMGLAEAPAPPAEQIPAEELAAHGELARNAAGASTSLAGTLDAKTVAAWPLEKKMSFAQTNPDHWESLKRGETVTGVAV